jgi:hypothetical protein
MIISQHAMQQLFVDLTCSKHAQYDELSRIFHSIEEMLVVSAVDYDWSANLETAITGVAYDE